MESRILEDLWKTCNLGSWQDLALANHPPFTTPNGRRLLQNILYKILYSTFLQDNYQVKVL
jgi:hypothetical protein